MGDPSRKVWKSAPKRGFTGEYALTEEEARKLLSSCGSAEDLSLLSLAISAGIRREDIVSVEVASLDLEEGWVSFYESKKRRTWKAPFGQAARVALQMHLQTKPKSRWLFPSPHDPARHLSGRAAYDRFQKWLRNAELKERPFHALRATCIKLSQRKGWTIDETMRLTGDTWRVISEHYATPTPAEMERAAKEKALI